MNSTGSNILRVTAGYLIIAALYASTTFAHLLVEAGTRTDAPPVFHTVRASTTTGKNISVVAIQPRPPYPQNRILALQCQR